MGIPNYRQEALNEANRFIALLLETFGEPPAGTTIKPDFASHDFGEYCQVVIDYNDEEGKEYAYNVEENCPLHWTA